MKKVLIVASVPSMIGQFNMSNIEILQKMGYKVAVACNFRDRAVWSEDKINELQKKLKKIGVGYYHISFVRDVFKISEHFKAYIQLEKLVKRESYEIIHCHTPIASAIARIVAHRTGTRIIYTAHGFHFFQGAPLKNWLFYYPVEKFLSRWTDCLITINREDYKRAKKKFHAERTEYIPGVGIDVEKFSVPDFVQSADGASIPYGIWRKEKREKLNLASDDFVIVSVGELNENKNHRVIIEAVAQLKNKKIKYLICGQGGLKDELENLTKKFGLEKQVFLLGFRNDVREILWMGDLFAFPSKREGLPVALMEAMASGLPCIASDIRGNRDLFEGDSREYLLPLYNHEKWAECIRYHKENTWEIKDIRKTEKKMYCLSECVVMERMKNIYAAIVNERTC